MRAPWLALLLGAGVGWLGTGSAHAKVVEAFPANRPCFNPNGQPLQLSPPGGGAGGGTEYRLPTIGKPGAPTTTARVSGTAVTPAQTGRTELGRFINTTGEVRVMFIPVEFVENCQGPDYSGCGVFFTLDVQFFMEGMAQRVVDYFDVASAGQLRIVPIITPVVFIPAGKDALDGDEVLFAELVVNFGDPFIDFRTADAVVFVSAGTGNELGAALYCDPCEKDANFDSLFAALWPVGASIPTLDGVDIAAFTVVSESERDLDIPIQGKACATRDDDCLENDDGLLFPNPDPFFCGFCAGTDEEACLTPNMDVFGVWIHELGHQLGLPDLHFAVDDKGVGPFDAMDNWGTTYPSNSPGPVNLCADWIRFPANFSAWSRVQLGWVQPVVIDSYRRDTFIGSSSFDWSTVPQSERPPLVYKLWTDSDPSSPEYFLIEYRNANTSSNRAGAPDQRLPTDGVLIWHIDERGTLLDTSHPLITLMSATGLRHATLGGPGFPICVPSDQFTRCHLLISNPFASFADMWPNAFHFLGTGATFLHESLPSSRSNDGFRSFVEVSRIRRNQTLTALQGYTGVGALADLFVSNLPRFRETRPASGFVTASVAPSIRTRLAGFDPVTLQVLVDGADVSASVTLEPDPSDPADPNRARLRVRPELVPGRHTLQIAAAEPDGFRVWQPPIGPFVPNTNTVDLSYLFRPKEIPEGLRMFGIPFALGEVDPADAILSTIFDFVGFSHTGTPDINDARIARWDPATQAYVRDLTALDFDFVSDIPGVAGLPKPIGQAFFLYVEDTSNTALTQLPLWLRGDPLDPLTSIEIPLRREWNMITPPYEFNVASSSIFFRHMGETLNFEQAIARGWVRPFVYTWEPEAGFPPSLMRGRYVFFRPPSGVLEAFRGYWLRVDPSVTDTGTGGIRLIFAPTPTSAAVQAKVPGSDLPTLTPSEWRIRFAAQGAAQRDDDAFIGASPDATRGYDLLYDREKSPPPPQYVSLGVPRTDWGRYAGRYAEEIRAPVIRTETWPLEVRTSRPGERVTLTWSLHQVPAHLTVTLTDRVAGRSVDLRRAASYTVTLAPGATDRQLMVAVTPQSGGGSVTPK